MLGDVIHDRRDEAAAILYDLERKAQQSSEKLTEYSPEASQMLNNEDNERTQSGALLSH